MMDGCDLTGGRFLLQDWRRQVLGAAVAARRKARRRRDLLNENVRALAKLDEALMTSLKIVFSSALEEQGAPATNKGGGGPVSHGEGILAGKNRRGESLQAPGGMEEAYSGESHRGGALREA